jgi:hypothetical protein
MKNLVPGTLGYYLSAPQFKAIPFGHVMSKFISMSCSEYVKTCNLANPCTEAVEFYTMNHLMTLLSQKYGKFEKLPDWAIPTCEKFHKVVAEQGCRMLYYMTLICTRESRHLSKTVGDEWWAKFVKKFGIESKNFHQKIAHTNSDFAAKGFMKHAPNLEFGKYLRGLADIFRAPFGFGGSFGGEPWANITETLAKCVEGETSLEVMLDTAYTLAHNGGPMFNKGMMYNQYDGYFIKILDVQRSGQMPELVQSGEMPLHCSSMESYVAAFARHMPGEFETEVCYDKVTTLGGIGHYGAEKKKAAAKKAMNLGPGKKAVGTFEYYPGESVTKYERIAA